MPTQGTPLDSESLCLPRWAQSPRLCREGKSSIISAHSATVRSVNFAANGRMLLTASDDKTLKVWALPSQRFMVTLSGHMNWVRTAQFSPDCRLAASGGDDKTMRIWDIQSKRLLRLYDEHSGVINSVAFHPDGTCVATAGSDKVIKVWDIRCVRPTLTSIYPPNGTRALATRAARLPTEPPHGIQPWPQPDAWRRRSNRLIQQYAAHTGAISSVRWHPSGNFLLSTSMDSTLKVWDVREGQLFFTLHGHEGAVYGCCFSPAGDFFASAGCDEQARLLALHGGLPRVQMRETGVDQTAGRTGPGEVRGRAWGGLRKLYTVCERVPRFRSLADRRLERHLT